MLRMNNKYIQLSSQFVKAIIFSNQFSLLKNNSENYLWKRWAGHSKWQNIKSIKEANDRNKGQAFTKLSRLMAIAIKENGDDPQMNYKLKQLLDEAKKLNMPKATIDKVLRAPKTSEKPYWIIFSGPKDLVVAFEVLFPNKKPSFLMTKFAPQTKKLKLKFETHFNHLCIEKGLIISEPPSGIENSYDKAVEDAIEIGVDEVFENSDKSLIFECLADRTDSLSMRLKDKGYNIISASTELDFNNAIIINEEELKDLETIINKLQTQYTEIIRVIHNAEVQ